MGERKTEPAENYFSSSAGSVFRGLYCYLFCNVKLLFLFLRRKAEVLLQAVQHGKNVLAL